ncbi:MAG TPA: DUF6084 family protein [Gemmatimonadaceae bacterium]|jgi:hypothetical protein|nr:DUF6084 family protein [Gemmatimonadaceae bacterium]
MPELTFGLESVAPVPFAAVPLLGFGLHVMNTPATERIHTVVLRSQVQLDVTRRPYSRIEQSKLCDLFGEPDRWSTTLRSMLWTHVSTIVPAFTGETTVEVTVPCTFDFNVAATKYFYGLDDGHVPLTFLFSGSIFYEDPSSALQVSPIPWDREATFRLPVRVWRQLIDQYYPNVAWLALRRDVFDRLYQYKQEHGITTWEQTVEEAAGP